MQRASGDVESPARYGLVIIHHLLLDASARSSGMIGGWFVSLASNEAMPSSFPLTLSICPSRASRRLQLATSPHDFAYLFGSRSTFISAGSKLHSRFMCLHLLQGGLSLSMHLIFIRRHAF